MINAGFPGWKFSVTPDHEVINLRHPCIRQVPSEINLLHVFKVCVPQKLKKINPTTFSVREKLNDTRGYEGRSNEERPSRSTTTDRFKTPLNLKSGKLNICK